MTQPNKDNPAKPSASAISPEQIRKSTQENQDRNRPDQNQEGQKGQRRVANDSSTPGYGVTGSSESEPRKNGLENQDDRVDDLGDSR